MATREAVGSTSHEAIEDSHINRTDVPRLADKEKLGVWFFLGGEVILFATLIITFGFFRITFAPQYAGFREHLSIPLIGMNTFVLILSSYFVVRALQAVKMNQQNGLLWNLLIVLALGAVFIGGQAYEWSQLFAAGIKLDSTFGAPFLIVTGLHGLHVFIGLAWASVVMVFGLGNAYDRNHHQAVEFFGLYWHFVDIVWIVLFSLIYLV